MDKGKTKIGSGAEITGFSTDGTLAGNSDLTVPTQKAIKTYVSTETGKNEINIVLNAFRIAVNGSLTQQNMVDGIVDEYEDESGIYKLDIPLLIYGEGTDEDTSVNNEGYGDNVTLTNVTLQDTQKYLNNTTSLYFNGTDAYLTVTDTSGTDYDIFGSNSDSWTLDLWVKHTDHLGFEAYFTQREDSSNRFYLGNYHGIGLLFRTVSAGATVVELIGTEISDSNWHHVALIKVGSNYGLYMDGTQIAYDYNTSSDTYNANLMSGWDGASSYFDGYMEQLQITKGNKFGITPDSGLTSSFSVPTTIFNLESISANISYNSTDDYYSPSSLYSLTTSPYFHAKCNDNAGNTTVTDDGTGANNGTASTNTSNLSVTGKITNAFDFNGSSEYVDLNNLATDIASDTTGSICIWFKATSANGRVFTISDASADTIFRIVHNYSNGSMDFYLKNAGTEYWYVSTSTAFAPANEWHHIAVVQNGTYPKFYLDGVDQNLTLSVSTNPGYWFVNLSGIDTGRIACRSINGGGNDSFYGGQVDDVRYYQNKALSSNEVLAIYNSGTGTEDDQPTSGAENMSLRSDTFTAEAQPDSGRIVVLEEDVDAITLNTDLKAYASRDGGTSWVEGTLVDEGDYDTSKRILVADFDFTESGIGTGTDLEYKLITDNNKELKLHGTGLLWD